MKLTALKYGTTEITERMAFQDGNEKTKLPIALLFFLIECQNKKILVDVGCDSMPGFDLFDFQKPVNVLESYGVDRSKITDIIITHSHHDHIDALRYYPQANIYLHRNEVKGAEKYLPKNPRLCLVEDHKRLFNKIEMKYIGGHSAGSCIVLISSAGKTYVLCGDECYTMENLLQNRPTGSSCCLEKSKKFVAEYRKEGCSPILFHDHGLVSEIGYKTLLDS